MLPLSVRPSVGLSPSTPKMALVFQALTICIKVFQAGAAVSFGRISCMISNKSTKKTSVHNVLISLFAWKDFKFLGGFCLLTFSEKIGFDISLGLSP